MNNIVIICENCMESLQFDYHHLGSEIPGIVKCILRRRRNEVHSATQSFQPVDVVTDASGNTIDLWGDIF